LETETVLLSIGHGKQAIEAKGKPIHLAVTEFNFVEFVALRKGTILTKGIFLNHFYGDLGEPNLKIIDIFIYKQRKNTDAIDGDNYIHILWGCGYVLRNPMEEVEAPAT
jgi:two-component system cell cycle response regulator CtrA